MNREKYLKELSKYLERLPKKDYEDAMNYFEEYFDEVGEEGEIELIRELGSPKEAGDEIISRLFDKRKENDGFKSKAKKFFDFKNMSKSQIVLIAILSVFALPILVPLLFASAMVVFSIFLVVIILMFTFGILALFAILIAGKLILVSLISAFSTSFAGGMILLGAGFIILGLGMLFISLCSLSYKSLVKLGIASKEYYRERIRHNEK